MPTAVLVLPILPDREEEWRRFAQDLLGERLGEYKGFARRMGVRGMKVYLARTGRQAVILACVGAGDLEEALRRFAASEESFDGWFKEKLAELHGFEVGRRAGSPSELLFEYPGDSGGL